MSAPISSTMDSITRQTLAGKQILLTGTTGFLGKVILEKLIRSVPDVAGITLLIRGNRRYPTAEERFRAEVATSSVFDQLRQEQPQVFEAFLNDRITCISGEITEERLGLERDSYEALAASIDVVINSAASVNFREALDKALTINTYCLETLADLAQAAGNVPFIQISTCYVNGRNAGTIKERPGSSATGKISRSTDGYHDIAAVFDRLNTLVQGVKSRIGDETAREAALIELGQSEANYHGWGDTYTFTKWLGEQLLLKRMRGKTLTIVRPSVIESCLEEPVAGWIEGVKVTDAILLAYARNKVSLFPGRSDGIVDIIPADLVANAVILATGEALREPGTSRIYQSCSGLRQPLVVRDYIRLICGEMKRNWQKYPKLAREAPRKKFTLVNKHLFVGLIQLLRGAMTLADRLAFRSASNKSKGLQAVETTLKLTRIYSTYTSPNYVFHNDRLMALADRCGASDQVIFPVDAARIDWAHYFEEVHIRGLNRYGMEDRKPKAASPVPADANDLGDELPESA